MTNETLTSCYTVFCTHPNLEDAAVLARKLVKEQLAACVNILPNIHSIYTWQGKVDEAQECLLVIKTTAALFKELENFIAANHPYSVPEIIALPVVAGLPDYLNWLQTNCRQ